MSNPTNINFWSEKNYLKRDSSTGSVNLAAPTTSAYGGTVFISQQTVTHNLGYVPFFTVYYEPFKDGVIWPLMGSRLGGRTTNPRNTATFGPYGIAWPTSTQLIIEIGYLSNSLTGTYPIYWVIYKDYGIA